MPNIIQQIDKNVDVVHQHLAKHEAMLITMHTALTEIVKCEASLDGGIAMRYIAEKSLVETYKILNKEGGKI